MPCAELKPGSGAASPASCEGVGLDAGRKKGFHAHEESRNAMMHAPAEAEIHRPLDMGAYARELRSEASSIQLSERKACDKLLRLQKRRWCTFVCC